MSFTWAYGILTVPGRLKDLLPQTLRSLAKGGFDKPRIFLDGVLEGNPVEVQGLEVTERSPQGQQLVNWYLALHELYSRNSRADRYALFEDDILICRNTRQYLERPEMPPSVYLNLMTMRANEALAKNKQTGWYKSNQKGMGAQGLVFDQSGMVELLTSHYLLSRFKLGETGSKRTACVDGHVAKTFQKTGRVEIVHYPSLVQHVGMKSMIPANFGAGWGEYTSQSFPGEDFDALSLVPGGTHGAG